MAPTMPEPHARCVLIVGEDQEPACDEALEQAAFTVLHARSPAEARPLLARGPDAVILRVAARSSGTSLRLLQLLQLDEPVPVLLLLDDLTSLAAARNFGLPLLDFLLYPHSASECVRRIELALDLRRRFQELSSRALQLEQQVSVDFKTGLISELYFRRILQLEWKRAQRHHNPLSLLLLDVDDFKGINDATSYEFGDHVLRQVGETVLSSVRETDYAARLGGDEFCVLLPQTPAAEATQTAQRIRRQIAALTVQNGGFRRQLTVSIGVDTHDGNAPATVENLRLRANQALQAAKHEGKDLVRSGDSTAALQGALRNAQSSRRHSRTSLPAAEAHGS